MLVFSKWTIQECFQDFSVKFQVPSVLFNIILQSAGSFAYIYSEKENFIIVISENGSLKPGGNTIRLWISALMLMLFSFPHE